MNDKVIDVKSCCTIFPWLICGLGALFYCYEYLLRIAPSVMMVDLMQAYQIDATTFGNLAAFYYYAYTPMQLPVGVLMDHYGPRRLLTLACLVCAGGSYLFGQALYIGLAEIGRFLVGFGSAFAFVGVLKLATIWLPPRRFALISGLTTSLGMIGGMFGDIYLTSLVNQIGWRSTILLSAAAGVLLAVAICLVVRDRHDGDAQVADVADKVHFKDVLIGAVKIFKKPQIFLCGLVGCLLYLSLSSFAELWGIPYLQVAHSLTKQQAALSVSMVFLGWMFGGPLVGWFSDAIGRRLLPLMLGAIGGTVSIGILLYWQSLPLIAINILLFLFGLFAAAEVVVFAIARESCPNHLSASALAIVNMLVMMGGVLFQPLTGYFLDLTWTGSLVDGVRHYTAESYKIALISLPIAFVLAFLLSLFMNETYCKVNGD
jgi:MFS family permease